MQATAAVKKFKGFLLLLEANDSLICQPSQTRLCIKVHYNLITCWCCNTQVDLRKVASNMLLQLAIANLLALVQAKQFAVNLLTSPSHMPHFTRNFVRSIQTWTWSTQNKMTVL